MFERGVAARDDKVLHVADPDGDLVVARPRRRILLAPDNVRPLARAKAELRRLNFDRACTALVMAGTWQVLHALRETTVLKFGAHRVIGTCLSREVFGRVVSATAWDILALLVLQFDAHVEPIPVVEGLRLYIVVTGCWHVLSLSVIKHSALFVSESELRCVCLDSSSIWVVLYLSCDVLSLTISFRRSETVIWRSFQSLTLEVIVSWSRHQRIVLLLRLVIVQRRHTNGRSGPNRIPLVIRPWGWRLMFTTGHFRSLLAAEAILWGRALCITDRVVVAGSRHALVLFGIREVDPVSCAHRIGRSA